MIGNIMNINHIVLDVLIISVFILIAFLGAIRGIKKAAINFIIFLSSLILSFSEICSGLKKFIARNFINPSSWLPAGISNVYKLGFSLFTTFLSSVCIFLLFYVILNITKIIFAALIIKNNIKPRNIIERIFGGVFAFLYQGVFLIMCLLLLNNNYTGLDATFEKTHVTKFIIRNSEKLLNKSNDNFVYNVTIKVFKGDLFYEVNDTMTANIDYVSGKLENLLEDDSYIGILNEKSLPREKTEEILRERIYDLNRVALLIISLDEYKISSNEFAKFSEEWIMIMNRAAKEKEIARIEFPINEIGAIRLNLKKAGLNDKTMQLFNEIVIEK